MEIDVAAAADIEGEQPSTSGASSGNYPTDARAYLHGNLRPRVPSTALFASNALLFKSNTPGKREPLDKRWGFWQPNANKPIVKETGRSTWAYRGPPPGLANS